ncbi:hypothetical protein CTI12_AA210900 [Artemisia annua]|uniref:Uncharacterized protein n=1 Tax=Artemisia annua TaxID=35608 RepID=A0A2U1NYX8_ARTAN|nr:hypothetical protein CTI12_AA210900 [Artemisia annua]
MSESMEIDPPHESDGSTTESKESETTVAADISGIGLPYAPENFPQPGDTWSWKVGKRIASKGHFLDRYLYIPDRLYQELKSANPNSCTRSRGFASKKAVERFVMETFPGMDIKAFFASFSWKIPSGKVKDRAENTDTNTDTVVYCTPKFDPAGCKAGNINCSSLLVINNPDHSNIMPCDLCCIEPLFCHDCCCILCSRPVSSEKIDLGFIKCEAVVKDGLICGHICHIECGLRSYMAGTLGGTVGLDAEYYCRRCDARTDLIPYVKNLFKSCESNSDGDKMQKILSLCAIMLRGSTKTSAKSLLHHVQLAAAKLKEGNSEDIWKLEDASAVTTGELSQSETDTLEVSNFKEPSQHGKASPQISLSNFDYRIESIKLEERIEKTLASLGNSLENECTVAEDALINQKNHLLDLYKELDKEKERLATCSPSDDQSSVDAVIKRMDQIKSEHDKIIAMQEAVGKGFGKTSKYVLK